MTVEPRALLELKWTVGADDEPAFDSWYDEEHLDDLLAVPGVLEARRLRRVAGTGPLSGHDNHLTHYRLRDRAVLDEPTYLRLGREPSERTREVAFSLPLERHVLDRVDPTSPGPTRSGPGAGLLVASVVAAAGASPAPSWGSWLDEVAARAGGPRARFVRPEPDPPTDDAPGAERTSDLIELAEVDPGLLDELGAAVPGHAAGDQPPAWGLELYRHRYAKAPPAG